MSRVRPKASQGIRCAHAAIALALAAVTASPLHAHDTSAAWVEIDRDTVAAERVNSHLLRALARLDSASPYMTFSQMRAMLPSAVEMNREGMFHVLIRCEEVTDLLVERLEGLGAKIAGPLTLPGAVRAWVPPQRILSVAALDGVTAVRPPLPAIARTGSVLTEGDAIHGADFVRTNLAVQGRGVRVGVISTGFAGWTDSVLTADMPGSFQILQPQGIADPLFDSEGTAMAEIVHDVAPEAPLFGSPVLFSDQFIEAVDLLRNAGCEIIVDDLGFLDEPFFEDGPVADAVAVSDFLRVTQVSSAGNDAQQHYEGDYVDSDPISNTTGGNDEDFHDFGGGDTTINVLVEPNTDIAVVLQWSDPFGSSGNDYNLFAFNSVGTLLDSSVDAQNGDDDPIEFIFLSHVASLPITVEIAVDKFSPILDDDRRLEMFIIGNPTPGLGGSGVANMLEHRVPEGSIFGHAGLQSVITVAAVSATDPGNDDVQSFSSQGPARLEVPSSFDRAKPNVAGIDTVSITASSGEPVPFVGTSAAAAHIAGIAALFLEANPTLAPSAMRIAMENTATDIEAPGFDDLSGFGLVDAGGGSTVITLVGVQSWNLYR